MKTKTKGSIKTKDITKARGKAKSKGVTKDGTKRTPKVKRAYKDTMFRMLFTEKENLLSLYNAINGTHYTDADDLEMNTLENAIYMGYKNDISFVINLQLYLYEHQSTINPNMPLRDLFYVSEILQDITKGVDLYSSSLQQIPTPEFVMFYNGREEKPERWKLKLSDAFQRQVEEPKLELVVTVLNINLGKNKKVMEACKALKDYALFVQKMRTYVETMTLEEAAERTIEECVREDVLADFLEKHRAEAKNMCRCLYEYDEEKHIREERKIAREKGWNEGWNDGWQGGECFKLVSQVFKKKKRHYGTAEIADMLEEDESVIRRICEAAEKYAPDYDIEKMKGHMKEVSF